jgi:type IV pilus assembly protein PilO
MKPNQAHRGTKGIDFNRLAQDFKGLDTSDPGVWPTAPKVAVFIGLLVATVAAAWWFDWREQVETLGQRQPARTMDFEEAAGGQPRRTQAAA